MQLTIEDEIIHALNTPQTQVESILRQILAVSLYAHQKLPLGPARKLAGLSRWEFEELLAREKVVRNYSVKDVQRDASLAKEDPLPPSPPIAS